MATEELHAKRLYIVTEEELTPKSVDKIVRLVSNAFTGGSYLRQYRVDGHSIGYPDRAVHFPNAKVQDGIVSFGGSQNPYLSDWKNLPISELEGLVKTLKAKVHLA